MKTIKEIIKKHIVKKNIRDIAIIEEVPRRNFPALESDLETLMAERAVQFAEWLIINNWDYLIGHKCWINNNRQDKTTTELYAKFLETIK